MGDDQVETRYMLRNIIYDEITAQTAFLCGGTGKTCSSIFGWFQVYGFDV